jgi:RNA polymerase sigma-70 factor (ECF subfamily)
MLAATGMTGRRQLDPARLGDHLDRLYRAALGLCGNRADADDLVQETYAQVLRRPRLLRSDDDLGYLLRVMRNTFISSYRAGQRRPSAEPIEERLDSIEDPGAANPEAHLERMELHALIAELPPDFRDALILVDLVGLSYREAGRVLGAKEATVTTRLHRARQRLARALTEVDHPATRDD